MWLILCMFVFVLPIRYADSSLADQMAEITQLCCSQGTTYARNHSSEDCSSSIPPDVDSTFGTLCIFAMDQCCKEYFTKKSDCESGIDLATSSKTCASTKDTGKRCCDHCMSGRAVGKTRGISACTAIVQGKSGEQLLAGDAFTQCCKNAVENESRASTRATTALAKKLTEYDLSPVASVCEEYAPNELCAHHCIPIPGSYKCECNPGFMLMADGRNCREVTKNRCKPHNPCQHKCNDNGVQVKCSCRRGYQLMSDGKSCEDINECTSDPPVCLPNTQCFNILGSYKCIPLKNKNNADKGHCPPGFARNLVNNACDDINECNLPNPPCPRFICENTIGGYKCGGVSGDPSNLSSRPQTPVEDRCPPGFVSGFNEECEDIDECSIGKDDCNKLSQFCINTRGAFYCQDKVSKHCPPGFKTDPVTNKCEDINECEDGQDICRSDQICINVPGEYDCKPKGKAGRNVNNDCPDGMRKNQATNSCEDIDECTEGTHLCDQYQRCLNTNGSHECHCKLGFELDPKTRACIDINECATDQNNCIPETQRCDNTVGSFLCIRFISCGTGYTLQHSTSTCEDIDECALGIHNCERAGPEYQCMNIPGSFRCQKPAPPLPEYEYEYYDEDEDVDPSMNKTEVITTTTLTPTTTETPKTSPKTTPVPTTKPTEPTPEEPKVVETEKPENNFIDDRINAIDKEADKRKPNINFYETEPPRQPDYSYSPQPNYNNLEPHTEPEIPKGADPNRIFFEPEPPKLPEYPTFENPEPKPTEKVQENVEPRQPNYYKPTELQPTESSQPNYYKPTESSQPNYYKPTEDIPHEPKETNYYEQTEPTRTDQVTPEIDNSIPIVYPGITETTYSPIPEYPTSPKLINVVVGQETASVRGEKNEDGSVSVDTKDLPKNEWTSINEKPNCQIGFELDQYGACFDVDECATNRHSCSGLTEVCRNTMGGYLCDCAIGFRRDLPSMACIPVTTSTSTTTTTTTSTTTPAPTTSSTRSYFWSYYGHKRPTSRPFRPRSSCDVGYHFNSETRKCEDVNECVNGQANCAAAEVCVNTEGGFRCECPPNWKLDPDRHRCVPNRSYPDIFPPYRNYPGYYPPVDPNEIIPGPKGPKVLAEPEITQVEDRGTVLKCPWGTRLGDDGTCEDVDECVTGEAQCGPLQICTNLHGGYTCSCPLGHRLVGDHQCEDVDECALSGNIPICSVNADCVNTIGSYQCRCHEGFKSAPANDKVCVDVDECSESYSGSLCQHRCNNVWGGYRCSCHRGYRLNADNRTCYDVDECTEFKNKNLCIGRCHNEPGSYRCSCPSGYRLSEDNRSCIDIDECETGEAPCSHGGQYEGSSDVCLNTRGSYRCYKITCPPGYQLEQKHRCTKIQRNCPPADWECAHQPSTYSYNFITFVSNLYIPESKVDLFTMRGPAWPGATMRFQLRVVNVDAPPTVKEKADINSFLLVQTNNQAVMSLVKPLQGLQSIELELSMELYSRGQFGGIAVAKIYIHVSEFEF